MKEPIILTKELKLFFLDILRSGEITADQVASILDLIGHPQINVSIDGKLLSATLKSVKEPINR